MKLLEDRYSRLAGALVKNELLCLENQTKEIQTNQCKAFLEELLPHQSERDERIAIAARKLALQKCQLQREWANHKAAAHYTFMVSLPANEHRSCADAPEKSRRITKLSSSKHGSRCQSNL